MSHWKYISDKQLDIINRGIPYTLKKGNIVKEVHVEYMRKFHADAIMECDENGEILVKKALKEATPASPLIPEVIVSEPIKAIEEKKSPISILEDFEEEKPKIVHKTPKTEVKHVAEKKPHSEKKVVDTKSLGIKNSAQLKAMFKEDLEELCKKIGVDETGSKGSLIKKISAVLNLK